MVAVRGLAVATALVGALSCGAGAPPELTLAAWIEEAERDTTRWRAAIAWCEPQPDHRRCQPVLRAKGEVLLRELLHARPAPDYDDGEHLSIVPPGLEEESSP